MPDLTAREHAATTQLACTLAPLVTRTIIDSVARQVGEEPEGSNKVDRIRDVAFQLWRDRRRHPTLESFVVTLTMEGYARHTRGTVEMWFESVQCIADAMRELGLRPGELTRNRSLKDLPRRKSVASPQPKSAVVERAREARAAAAVHSDVIRHLGELATDPSFSPQARGRQLEFLVLQILQSERLDPQHRVVNPGEEIDLAFVLKDQHYLMECKWEKSPVGLPVLRDFMAKVKTKAEGTFGVVLSMSGYVTGINEKARAGQRLSSVGLCYQHLVQVAEGRRSWADTVLRARAEASRRSNFYIAP